MLTRAQRDPFVRVRGDRARVAYLTDSGGRVLPFLDRLCHLMQRVEGAPRARVEELLRRQERRVRDAARLAGLARTLLLTSDFRPPPLARHVEALRAEVFRARGSAWPPIPGDELTPYEVVAARADVSPDELQAALYCDHQVEWRLHRAPGFDGRALLARYNLELARAVLCDATSMQVRARGGWRRLFTATRRLGLMYELTRRGRSYELAVTGPAAAFLVRPARYGVRFARLLTTIAQAPAWHVHAALVRDDRTVSFTVAGAARARRAAPIGGEPKRERLDSAWERRFLRDLRDSDWVRTRGWQVTRERSPIVRAGHAFLPDFTLRHADGREAAVELVGFWTADYLTRKLAQVAAAGDATLVLVVATDLAMGPTGDDVRGAVEAAAPGRVVWVGRRPRVGDVMRVVERVTEDRETRDRRLGT